MFLNIKTQDVIKYLIYRIKKYYFNFNLILNVLFWMVNAMSKDRIVITLSVSNVLHDRLKKFLEESGLSQSSVIREAMDMYLRSKEGMDNTK